MLWILTLKPVTVWGTGLTLSFQELIQLLSNLIYKKIPWKGLFFKKKATISIKMPLCAMFLHMFLALFIPKYRKIPLFGLYSEWGLLCRGRSLYSGEKNSICNLLNLLFFLFSSIKHVLRHFSRRPRCKICSKLTTKTPSIRKINDKAKNKDTADAVLPLYC